MGYLYIYIYIIYCIENSYMFRRLVMAIFRLNMKHLLSSYTVVKVLCYKSAGRGFDSRWCHWNFSVT